MIKEHDSDNRCGNCGKKAELIRRFSDTCRECAEHPPERQVVMLQGELESMTIDRDKFMDGYARLEGIEVEVIGLRQRAEQQIASLQSELAQLRSRFTYTCLKCEARVQIQCGKTVTTTMRCPVCGATLGRDPDGLWPEPDAETQRLRAEKAESELERARRDLPRIAGGLKSIAGACVDEKPYPEIREMVMEYAHQLTELANSEGLGGE